MTQDPFARRLLRFRQMLQEEGMDAFLVAVPENRYYLSGFGADDLQLTESSGYLLITDSRQYLLTDSRYEEEARQDAPGYEPVIYRSGLADVLPDLFSSLGTRRLGVEGQYLTYAKFREVESALEEVHPDAVITSDKEIAERMRVIKEPEEIERIRESLAVTEKVLKALWDNLQPGRKEKDVAWEIERRIREEGAQGVSFPPIAGSGPNAALPHAVPTDRGISPGDPVILDLGSRLRHYCSDMTRTWIAGRPDPRLQEIYRIVREAQLAAQEVIRAGMSSTDVDRAAREVIERAGYGDHFGHGLGHGVGLAVHEPPRLRKLHPTTLEENMVVTIEPGIYLPGFGGVRLENMVRITETGCEVLNRENLFYSW